MSLPVRSLAAGLVVGLAVSLVQVAGAVAQDQSDLERARAQIAAVEADIAAAAVDADRAELALDQARDALDRVEAIVNAVAQRVGQQQDAVVRADAELRRLEAEEDAVRLAIRAKAIDLYKRGPGTELTTMIDAQDIRSAIDRSAFIRRVGESDRARIEDLDAAGRRSLAAREVLEVEQALLDTLLADQQVVMSDAEDLRDSRALTAATTEDRVEDLEHDHDELEDLESEIERAIAQRQAAAEAARREAAAARAAAARTDEEPAPTPTRDSPSSPASDPPDVASPPPPPTGGGGYAWPLCGPVTSEFKWRWGRQHKGMDIDDTYDRSISAAQSGTVISAGWNSGGYGNLVLIQHADGVVTAYAHASSVSVSTGQSVSRGQVIATVGSTGNSTGPHLHFETRVGGSSAVNPRQFLSGSGC